MLRPLLTAIVAVLLTLPPAEAQEKIGNFTIVRSTDPFDDADRSAILNVGGTRHARHLVWHGSAWRMA